MKSWVRIPESQTSLVFRGKRFRKHSDHFFERGALSEAKKLKREGFVTKTVKTIHPFGGVSGFAVFKRKRS